MISRRKCYRYPIKNTGNPGDLHAEKAAFYFYIDDSNQVYLVLTLDEPGSKSRLGKGKKNKKGNTVWQEKSMFAMNIQGSDDIPNNTIYEVVMDDEQEQVMAAKVAKRLPLGRCGMHAREPANYDLMQSLQ